MTVVLFSLYALVAAVFALAALLTADRRLVVPPIAAAAAVLWPLSLTLVALAVVRAASEGERLPVSPTLGIHA